jgi:hypothetical protein
MDESSVVRREAGRMRYDVRDAHENKDMIYA